MEEKLVSRRELAKGLGLHYLTVYRLSKSGLIRPHCFVGKQPRYVLTEVLDQFVEAGMPQQKGGAECKA